MEYFKYIILLSVFVSACCGFAINSGCQEYNGIHYINYNGFLNSELDSVYLFKYQKNTNFTILLDSVSIKVDTSKIYNNRISSSLVSSNANYTIMANNDYKIFIKDIDRTISISEIKEEEQSCKKCGSVKKIKNVGISSLKQDSIVVTINPKSGFLYEISIAK